MKLRKLSITDASAMLNWMHDIIVVENLGKDFLNMTLSDCQNFIQAAQDTSINMHLAIVNDYDEYQGTVSLKNITSDSAEFAIVVCRGAMGKGYSAKGMQEIIRIGFEECGLSEIYWNVLPDNLRARHFYDKHGFQQTNFKNIHLNSTEYSKQQICSLIWYSVLAKSYWKSKR